MLIAAVGQFVDPAALFMTTQPERRTPMVAIIVARATYDVIGNKGDMPWGRSLKADLRRFRWLTSGHAVIMGRKTFESIGSPLPHRQNIVLSSGLIDMPGIQVAGDLEAACNLVEPGRNVFIIGGGRVYRDILPVANVVYETLVLARFEGDVTFPRLSWQEWRLTEAERVEAGDDTPYPLVFRTWERI